MFAYQPQQSRAGEYMARGIVAQGEADLANALRRQEMIGNIGSMIGDIGSTVAGFAMGGPAGAAMATQGGGGGGGGEGLIGSLINSFANRKAMDAKDKAYMGFFERHGDDLGFDAEYLEQLKNMPREERLASFDLMTSQPGQRLGSLQYMNQQANLFGGGRGTGGGGAPSGGGGSQRGYQVGQGWVGYGS